MFNCFFSGCQHQSSSRTKRGTSNGGIVTVKLICNNVVLANHSLFYPSTLQSLVEYCQTNLSSRGLERWLCRTYAVSRAKELNDAKHAVLLEQARQFLTHEQDEEALAEVAQAASRKGRAFAFLLGKADAAAARLSPQQDDIPTRSHKRIEPIQDFSLEDPISDDSSQEGEAHAAAPIFISIQTLA